MASSPKLVCLFLLLCSLQTFARDSQFFSKVTRNRDETTTTTSTPNTNNDHFINNKEDDFVHLNKHEKPEEQPNFIPQTTETGYGLYGHETGLDPPSTTSTTTTSLYNMDENNNNYENFNNYYKNNNENHDKNYVPELQGLSYTDAIYSKPWSYNTNGEGKYHENNNFKKENFNNYYMNNNEDQNEKNYVPESKGLSYTDAFPSKGWSYNTNGEGKYRENNNFNNGEGKYYGTEYNGMEEKQGMTDTRFLENGKYFYDLNAKEKYANPTNNYMSYDNKYNTNGYYGNKETNYEEVYNNNKNMNNKFYNGNGMQKFQSQVPEEEEFDFDQP